ncbi:hypothetical protein [Tateyamaria sp.]|uniref:hypothetical protein n=1 Tax=Tateyamaria sp. TaxID=1929288 RepID=UPI00329D05E9
MAEAENPLTPIHDKVVKIRSSLYDFLRNVLTKMRPVLRSLVSFMSEVRKAAKDLAKAVGDQVVQNIITAGDQLLKVVTFVDKQVIETIKMADKILAIIRKSNSAPEKAFKIVKTMTARLAKLFRTVLSKVFEVVTVLNPIDIALSLMNKMKRILQMVFKWVGQVGQIASGVKRAKNLIKKSVKQLKTEAKEVTKLVKDVNKLKPA